MSEEIYPTITGQGLNMDGVQPGHRAWLNFRQFDEELKQWILLDSVEVKITDFNETSIRCELVGKLKDESLLNDKESTSKELHWRKHTYFSYKKMKK